MGKRLFGPIVRWVNGPGNTNRDALIVDVLGTVLFGGAAWALLAGAFESIDLGIEVPIWVAVLVGALGLAIRALFSRATTGGTQPCPGWGRTDTSSKVLRPYIDHALLLLSLGSFEIDRALSSAAKLLAAGTGAGVDVALWIPQAPEAADGFWDLRHHPTQSALEAADFRVSVAGSWIAHNQTLHGPGAVFGHRDIPAAVEPAEPAEPDLKAFYQHGRRSLLCCGLAVEISGERVEGRVGPCLVVAFDAAAAAGEAEETYLRLLAVAFEQRLRERWLDEQLGNGGATVV